MESLKKVISLNQAAEISGYSQDYLGYLIRRGEVKGIKKGRVWFTTEKEIKKYLSKKKNLHKKLVVQDSLKVISLNQGAKISGYTQDYLGSLIRKGEMKGEKIGSNWVTTEEDIKKYISKKKAPHKKLVLKDLFSHFLARNILIYTLIIFVGLSSVGFYIFGKYNINSVVTPTLQNAKKIGEVYSNVTKDIEELKLSTTASVFSSQKFSLKIEKFAISVGDEVKFVGHEIASGWNKFAGRILNRTKNFLANLFKPKNSSTKIVVVETPPSSTLVETPEVEQEQSSTIIQKIIQTGLTGKTGPRGEQGLRGFIGLQGLTGPQGPAGISIDTSPFVLKSFLTMQVDKIFDSIANSTQGLANSLGQEVNTKLLTSSNHTTLATGINTINTFGTGSGAINTFGALDGTNTINGGTTINGSTAITGTNTFNVGTGLTTLGGDINVDGSTGMTFSGIGAGITFSGTGNHDIVASSGTLRFGSNTIIGNVEALDNTVDLGTPGVRFDKIYANEVNATTLVGTITGGNSSAETLTINSDNTTADTEDSFLAFKRGSEIPNALIQWNSTTKKFILNAPLELSSGIGTATFLSPGLITGQAGADISGGDLSLGINNITMTGSLGATGARLTKGWFTDLEVTNTIAGSVTGNAGTVTNGVYTTDAGSVFEVPLTFNSGLTRASNTITNDLITGVAGGQTIIGGTAIGDGLTYKSTTGAGTATGIAHQFVGGTDGGTTAMTILNDGNVGIGSTGVGLSPSSPLSIEVNSNTAKGISIYNTSTGSAASSQLSLRSANATIIISASNYYAEGRVQALTGEKLSLGANYQTGMTFDTSNNIEITSNFTMPLTTGTTPYGIIYKGTSPFISDFNYGNNGTVTTNGKNTFVGIGAGNLTMGSTATDVSHSSYNTAIGNGALTANTKGYQNTAIGLASLFSNTTGYNNTAIGLYSLHTNTTGYQNTANGMYSLRLNTTGYYNTANGYASLYSNTTGTNNTANGINSLYSNTTGTYNTAIGLASLLYNTTGTHNTANGVNSLYSNTTGTYNSAIGYHAGRYIADGATGNTTSDYSLYLGTNTKAGADGNQNEIVIGYDAIGNGSNSVTLGNTSITKTILQGNIGIGTTTPTANFQVAQGTAGVGTVSTPGSSVTLTGVGTQFTNTFKVGDTLTVTGETVRTIATITSDTVLTVTVAFSATPRSAVAYTLTGGTRFSVLGNGNVGIGTTSPHTQLELFTSGDSSNLSLSRNYPSGVPPAGTIIGKVSSRVKSTYTESERAKIEFVASPTSVYWEPQTDISFSPAGGNAAPVERFRMTASGKLGIGTTQPYSKISFGDGIDTTDRIAFYEDSAGLFFRGFGFVANDGINGYGLGIWSTPGGTASDGSNVGFVLRDSGNVGIGVTAPLAVLHLKAGTIAANTAPLKFTSGALNTTAEAGAIEFLTDAYYGTITTGAERKQFAFTSDITNSALLLDQTTPQTITGGIPIFGVGLTSSLLIGGSAIDSKITYKSTTGAGTATDIAHQFVGGTDGGTTALTILNDGNVGIGTTAPKSELDVNGGLSVGTYAGVSAAPANGMIISGNVGIGTTSPDSGNKLQVAGNIGYSGNFAIYPRTSAVNDWFLGKFNGTPASIDNALGTGNEFRIGSYSGSTFTPNVSLSGGATGVNSYILNGNVGIGTTTPGVALDVVGSSKISSTLAIGPATTWNAGIGNLSVVSGATGAPILSLKNTSSADQVYYASYNNADKSLQYIVYGSTAAGTMFGQPRANAAVILSYNSPSSFLIGSYNNTPVIFGQNNTERMRIDSTTGNVGIGTGSPSNKLSVAGGADFSGNVGIGTTNPFLGQLHVNKGNVGGLGGDVWITNNAANTTGNSARLSFGLESTTDSVSNSYIQATITNSSGYLTDLTFGTYGGGLLERMRITNAGNVGIGTTGPGAVLDVVGDIRLTTSLKWGLNSNETYSNLAYPSIYSSATSGAVYPFLTAGNLVLEPRLNGATRDVVVMGTGAVPVAVFQGSGNVGIGTTNPTHLIELDADTYGTTAGWVDSSDRNKKENFTKLGNVSFTPVNLGSWTGNGSTIDAIEYGTGTSVNLTDTELLSRISLMPIYQYNFIEDGDINEMGSGAVKHIGPTAQDFYKSFGLGAADTRIKATDMAGISLAAIKAMNLKVEDLSSLDTTSATSLGSLIKNFLADIGNGLEKIFAKEVNTDTLCVSDATGAKTCINKAQLDDLLAGAGGSGGDSSGGGSGDETPTCTDTQTLVDGACVENTPSEKTPTEKLQDANAKLTALVIEDYTTESAASFATAKDAALLLPESDDTEKLAKVKAIDDALALLVLKPVPPTCEPPQILEVDVCVTPQEEKTCTEPQILVDGECVDA